MPKFLLDGREILGAPHVSLVAQRRLVFNDWVALENVRYQPFLRIFQRDCRQDRE
jgi:hypothetical protein